MNIDQYIAQQAQESSDQPAVQNEVTPEVTQQTNEPEVTEPKSTKISIDGIGEVDPSEIAEWKRGYMRTQDYTRKTQEVANQRKEAEKAIQFYQQVQERGAENVEFNPYIEQIDQIKAELTNFKVEKEIETLQSKYNDFDAMEVLNVAMEKGFDTLEEAYIFNKGSKVAGQPIDEAELTRKIREEVLREIEQERKANTSIISTSDINSPIINETPKLSAEEDRVRQQMNMSVDEWLQWR